MMLEVERIHRQISDRSGDPEDFHATCQDIVVTDDGVRVVVGGGHSEKIFRRKYLPILLSYLEEMKMTGSDTILFEFRDILTTAQRQYVNKHSVSKSQGKLWYRDIHEGRSISPSSFNQTPIFGISNRRSFITFNPDSEGTNSNTVCILQGESFTQSDHSLLLVLIKLAYDQHKDRDPNTETIHVVCNPYQVMKHLNPSCGKREYDFFFECIRRFQNTSIYIEGVSDSSDPSRQKGTSIIYEWERISTSDTKNQQYLIKLNRKFVEWLNRTQFANQKLELRRVLNNYGRWLYGYLMSWSGVSVIVMNTNRMYELSGSRGEYSQFRFRFKKELDRFVKLDIIGDDWTWDKKVVRVRLSNSICDELGIPHKPSIRKRAELQPRPVN